MLSTELSYSVAQSRPTLCDPWTVARQGPLSVGIPSQENEWVAISSCRDLPDPGIELIFLAYPALGGGFFTNEPPGKTELSYHPVIPPLGIYPREV